MVFSQTHAWIFTKPATVGKYSYICCISYSSISQGRSRHIYVPPHCHWVRVRATVKLSGAFFHDESSIGGAWKGGGRGVRKRNSTDNTSCSQTNSMFFHTFLAVNKKRKTIPFVFNVSTSFRQSSPHQKHLTTHHNKLPNFFY